MGETEDGAGRTGGAQAALRIIEASKARDAAVFWAGLPLPAALAIAFQADHADALIGEGFCSNAVDGGCYVCSRCIRPDIALAVAAGECLHDLFVRQG